MTRLGNGRAEAITDLDIYRLALRLDVPPENLEAIAKVESNGFGYFDDGRMKILFEKHWFYKLLPEAKRTNASKNGLARKNWISPKDGGYKDQNTADQRYDLLSRAMKVDENAALQSISMGKFQIMGFNYEMCGFKSVREMWDKFLDSEVNQLQALSSFLTKKKLIASVRSGDWQAIETGYNGGGLNGSYAKKMKLEADKLKTKWRHYKPKPEGIDPALRQDTFDGGSNEGIIGKPETVTVNVPTGPATVAVPAASNSPTKLISVLALLGAGIVTGLLKHLGAI